MTPGTRRRLARWIGSYLLLVALSVALGRLTPLGVGNALFFAGVACIAASLFHIRLGGPKTLVGRSMKGVPQYDVDEEKRRAEIARGWRLFFLGLALWALLPLLAYFSF